MPTLKQSKSQTLPRHSESWEIDDQSRATCHDPPETPQGHDFNNTDNSAQQSPHKIQIAVEALSMLEPSYDVVSSTSMASRNTQPSSTDQTPVGCEMLGPVYLAELVGADHIDSQRANVEEDHDAAELDYAYTQYQIELRQTFEYINEGRLADAGYSIVNISRWLLGNVEVLGLIYDEEALYPDRAKLWEEFNTAWLAALEKQMEMIHEGQQPQSIYPRMDTKQMISMGDELVQLCDILEKHGLVDYDMGVWEEKIISLLNSCLNLSENDTAAHQHNIEV